MISLKALLAEQTSGAGTAKPTMTTKPSTSGGGTAKPTNTSSSTPLATTKPSTTINLYKDQANKISYDTGVIKNPKDLDKLVAGAYVEFTVATNNHGWIVLRWYVKTPNQLQQWQAKESNAGDRAPINVPPLYNTPLFTYLRKQHIKPKRNPNATFAQTGDIESDNTMA